MIALGFTLGIPTLLMAWVTSAVFRNKPKVRWIAAGIGGSLTMGALLALLGGAWFLFAAIDWDPDPRPALRITNTTGEPVAIGFDGSREIDPALPRSEQHREVFLDAENVTSFHRNPDAGLGDPSFNTLRPECSADSTLPPALAISTRSQWLRSDDVELVYEFPEDFCPFEEASRLVWDGEELREASIFPDFVVRWSLIFLVIPLVIAAVVQLSANRTRSEQDDLPPPPPPARAKPSPPPPPSQPAMS